MRNPLRNPFKSGLIGGLIVMVLIVGIPLTLRFTRSTEQGLDGRIYKTNTVYTVEHDGHLFVIYNGSGVLHHPNCMCLKVSDT